MTIRGSDGGTRSRGKIDSDIASSGDGAIQATDIDFAEVARDIQGAVEVAANGGDTADIAGNGDRAEEVVG